MPSKNLTQSFIDRIDETHTSSKIDYFDTKQTGLMLKVLKTGRKSFYLRYRDLRHKQAEKRLADASILSLKEARTLAKEKLAELAMGSDPFEKKKILKQVPTVRQFVEQSYLPHAKSYKRSWETDVSLLKNHIIPTIGALHLDQVKRQHMVDLFSHHRATHKPGSTNRVIILCRYIFNCAIKWEVEGLSNNPTSGIDLFQENNKRERYLTEVEAQRLFEQLERSQNKQLKYIVAMLLMTGARKSEVLNSQWKDFDLEKRIWTIEFNKTGHVRYIPISDGVLQLLRSLPRIQDCEYAFTNPDTKKPYIHLFQAWNTARKRAGLPDVRIHDLRHSFASFLINSGRSLYEVQKILGHTQTKTTQRYAHLSHESLISAANTAIKAVPLGQMMPSHQLAVPLVSAHTETRGPA